MSLVRMGDPLLELFSYALTTSRNLGHVNHLKDNDTVEKYKFIVRSKKHNL